MNAQGFRIAAWIGLIPLVGAMIYLGMLQKWTDLLVLSIYLLLALVFLFSRERLPTIFSLLFVVAALLNGFGFALDFWHLVPYYDWVAHAYTSFAITLAVGFLAYSSVRVQFAAHSWLFAIAVGSLGLALGALWEIFEWLMSIPQTYTAVAIDLIMDTLGVLVAAILAMWIVKRQGVPGQPSDSPESDPLRRRQRAPESERPRSAAPWH